MGTLQITDGTNTVSFLNSSGLYIIRGGYKQAVGNADPLTGDVPDVVDQLDCVWMATTDDSRDAEFNILKRLAKKAMDYRRLRRPNDEVWLAVQTHSETNVRYHIVSNVTITELDHRHFGPNNPVDLSISITREGAGRSIAPGSSLTTIVAAVTKYMKDDSDGNNALTIANTDVPGDMDALTVISIDPGATTPIPVNYLVAAVAFDGSTQATDFNPLFEATDEADNAASQVADTDAPDDVIIRRTATAALRWNLSTGSRAFPSYVNKDYLVFAAVDGSGAGSATLQFRHGQGYITQAPVNVNSIGSPATLHYLGRHRIPGGRYNAQLSQPAGGYSIYLDVTITGTYTVDFFQMWLVPVGNLMEIRDAAVDTDGVVVMNGVSELVYETTSGGEWRESSASSWDARGKYITLEAGRYNRVFFFLSGLGGLMLPNWSYSVTVKGLHRFTGIRGNL